MALEHEGEESKAVLVEMSWELFVMKSMWSEQTMHWMDREDVCFVPIGDAVQLGRWTSCCWE